MAGSVALPLPAFGLAARLARQCGDTALADACAALLAGVERSPTARALQREARGGVPDGQRLFERDAIDVELACLVVDRVEAPFRLRGCGPRSAAGSFVVNREALAWVDAPWPQAHDCEDLLPPERQREAGPVLARLTRHAARARVPDDPDLLLELLLPGLDGLALSDLPATGEPPVAGLLTLGLIVPDPQAPGGACLRALGQAHAVRGRGARLAVRVAADLALEIHAAALAGHWLHLEGHGLRLLMPPLDFTEPGASTRAMLSPDALLRRVWGLERSFTIRAGPLLARALLARFAWCAPADAPDWWSLAVASP
jgi:hypothetical protein